MFPSSTRAAKARRRIASLLLRFGALALVVAGCESVSRDGFRKLAEYDFHRFATLDPNAMHAAVEHDSRIEVDLENTWLALSASRGDKSWMLTRLSAGVQISSAPRLSGLPPAADGRTWTLLGLRPEEHSRATELQDLIRLFSTPFRSRSKVFDLMDKMNPNTGLRGAKKGEIQMRFSGSLWFKPPREPSGQRLPTSVWLVIDPRDGYFRLIDNSDWWSRN